MRTGLEIFLHALRMIFGNLRYALLLSAVPFGLICAVYLFVGGSIAMDAPQSIEDDIIHDAIIGAFIAILVNLILFCWLTVGWHRFILLSEYPTGVMPKFHGHAVKNYVIKSILVGLIMVMCLVPLSFLIVMLAQSIAGIVLIHFALGVLTSAIFFRMGMVLPAAAIGNKQTFGWSWTQTSEYTPALIVVAILSTIGYLVLDFLGSVFISALPSIGLVIGLVIQWLTVMFGASLLTTIYGISVEGRKLS